MRSAAQLNKVWSQCMTLYWARFCERDWMIDWLGCVSEEFLSLFGKRLDLHDFKNYWHLHSWRENEIFAPFQNKLSWNLKNFVHYLSKLTKLRTRFTTISCFHTALRRGIYCHSEMISELKKLSKYLNRVCDEMRNFHFHGNYGESALYVGDVVNICEYLCDTHTWRHAFQLFISLKHSASQNIFT